MKNIFHNSNVQSQNYHNFFKWLKRKKTLGIPILVARSLAQMKNVDMLMMTNISGVTCKRPTPQLNLMLKSKNMVLQVKLSESIGHLKIVSNTSWMKLSGRTTFDTPICTLTWKTMKILTLSRRLMQVKPFY
eukprot:UN28120